MHNLFIHPLRPTMTRLSPRGSVRANYPRGGGQTMYDYRKAICNDIRAYIDNNIDLDSNDNIEALESTLNDDLWAEDSVTGNASGSYTFNRETAKEYVEDNLDLLHESCEELGVESSTIGEWFMNQDYETMDVTIRCYLLSECIHTVLDELTN